MPEQAYAVHVQKHKVVRGVANPEASPSHRDPQLAHNLKKHGVETLSQKKKSVLFVNISNLTTLPYDRYMSPPGAARCAMVTFARNISPPSGKDCFLQPRMALAGCRAIVWTPGRGRPRQ